MTTSNERSEPLYLEALSPGLRFTSGTHTLDEAQIKAFAKQFDPQPFHLEEDTEAGSQKSEVRSQNEEKNGLPPDF